MKAKLRAHDISFVAAKELAGQAGQVALFFSAQSVNGQVFLADLKFQAGMNICKIIVKSQNKVFSEFCKQSISKIIG